MKCDMAQMASKGNFLSFNTAVIEKIDLSQYNKGHDAEQRQPFVNTWCVWRQAQNHKQTQEKYNEQTRLLVSLSNVQQFWTYWPALPQPSSLLQGNKMTEDKTLLDAIMIFREGCRPEWEDPQNAEGGHFQFMFRPEPNDAANYLVDEYWNNLILTIVGDSKPWVKYITGLRLVDKLTGKTPALRIEVWFSNLLKDDAERKEVKAQVEQIMARKLSDPEEGPSTGKVPNSEIKLHSK